MNDFNKNISFKEASLALGLGRNKLLSFLRSKGVLYIHNKRNVPYAKYENKGWFYSKMVSPKNSPDGLDSVLLLRLTPKGFEGIESLYKNHKRLQKEKLFVEKCESKLQKIKNFFGLESEERICRILKFQKERIIEVKVILDKGFKNEQTLIEYNIKDFRCQKSKNLQVSMF